MIPLPNETFTGGFNLDCRPNLLPAIGVRHRQRYYQFERGSWLDHIQLKSCSHEGRFPEKDKNLCNEAWFPLPVVCRLINAAGTGPILDPDEGLVSVIIKFLCLCKITSIKSKQLKDVWTQQPASPKTIKFSIPSIFPESCKNVSFNHTLSVFTGLIYII